MPSFVPKEGCLFCFYTCWSFYFYSLLKITRRFARRNSAAVQTKSAKKCREQFTFWAKTKMALTTSVWEWKCTHTSPLQFTDTYSCWSTDRWHGCVGRYSRKCKHSVFTEQTLELKVCQTLRVVRARKERPSFASNCHQSVGRRCQTFCLFSCLRSKSLLRRSEQQLEFSNNKLVKRSKWKILETSVVKESFLQLRPNFYKVLTILYLVLFKANIIFYVCIIVSKNHHLSFGFFVKNYK